MTLPVTIVPGQPPKGWAAIGYVYADKEADCGDWTGTIVLDGKFYRAAIGPVDDACNLPYPGAESDGRCRAWPGHDGPHLAFADDLLQQAGPVGITMLATPTHP